MCGMEEGFKNTAFFASPHRAPGMDVTIYVPHSYIVANWFVILGKKFKMLLTTLNEGQMQKVIWVTYK